MRFNYLIILILFISPVFAEGDPLIFQDAKQFLLLGNNKLEQDSFFRLPQSLKNKVREPVWQLSKNSAGLSVDFATNSSRIVVKWHLLNNFHMNHMAGTGIRGLDLYCRVKNHWQYVKTAIPRDSSNQQLLIENMSLEMRTFRLYLPLYDGIKNLAIGIDSSALIKKPALLSGKPLIFYGTSITQGGCASRPGMAYTNIISRKLNRECINLGFSGNGRMENPISEYIASIDAAIIIIDCLPNMTADSVAEKTAELIYIIRKQQPTTPIVFIENLVYESAYFDSTQMELIYYKNKILKTEIIKMQSKGFENIYLIESDNLLGQDHEGTVDGVHLTDLGFMRFSDNLIKKLRELDLIE